MGYIHCCAGLRQSKVYSLIPENDYLLAQMDYLVECPVCGHAVIQITRIDKNNEVSIYRKINERARKLFEKLKKSIIAEKKSESFQVKNQPKFYLYYSEYGVKKKCYSNLSSLKMGMFENKDLKYLSKV